MLLKCRSHEQYHPLFSGNMASRMPYVILIGNVGAGKSTLVEKVSGDSGMSSAASTSLTKDVDVILSVDDSFIICGTPGTNSITDQFSSNIEIKL